MLWQAALCRAAPPLLLLLPRSALSGHISIIVFQLPPSDTHIIFCFDFTRNISTGRGEGGEKQKEQQQISLAHSECVALWASLEASRIGFAHSTRQSQQKREKHSYNGITIKTIFELNAPTMMMILLPSVRSIVPRLVACCHCAAGVRVLWN